MKAGSTFVGCQGCLKRPESAQSSAKDRVGWVPNMKRVRSIGHQDSVNRSGREIIDEKYRVVVSYYVAL